MNQNILQQPESQIFERKRSLGHHDDGLKSLCGMINAESAEGSVAFGIGPDGEIVGIEPGDLDSAQRSLSQRIINGFDPPIQHTIHVLEQQEKRVLIVKAQRNRNVPYHEFNGRASIREGTITRYLTLNEKQSLQRQRDRDLHTGPWKCNRCGTYMSGLNSIMVSSQGVHKSYACSCGGEYWPAT